MANSSEHRFRCVVSIINYRTGPMTIDCLKSVLADFGDLDGHIVVVDNDSGDGSADLIADWIATQPKDTPVTLVRSDDNSGFSGGHNLGMAQFDADYYLVLNSDAIVHEGFFDAILAAADANPKVGLVAPKIAGDDGEPQTSCFRFPGPASEFIRSACTGIVTRLLKKHEVALGPYPKAEDIEWASFACILLRGQMVNKIGPMDEGYFLYFEDAEYCLRARRAGWEIIQTMDAVAVHYRGGSGPVKTLAKAKKRMPPYYYASRTRFLYQAHGRGGLILANIMYYAGRSVAQLRRLAGKGVYRMAEAEMIDLWTNVRTPLGPHPRTRG